ncbi:hypothetical protein HDV05_000023 [Chytridiales sp. JEL 0842]|nr:hypothetical protein HDV05_000023 [Chytridiales sp. JEL 0842]
MPAPTKKDMHYDTLIIGGGVSGLVTLKSCLEQDLSCLLLESKTYLGGLWTYSPKRNDPTVMLFTHINVSKQNYSFSDFPYSDKTRDYCKHDEISSYFNAYADKFQLREHIKFGVKATRVEPIDKTDYSKGWKVTINESSSSSSSAPGATNSTQTIYAKAVAIATGHHSVPNYPSFKGQDKYTGVIEHTVEYKDAALNGVQDKRVLVVGVGNSAVDVAVNCVGVASRVALSTRTGAWIFPNYILGSPTDHYASRLMLALPWRAMNLITELILNWLNGPTQHGFPRPAKAMISHPTTSPFFLGHIARGSIETFPNIQQFDGGKSVLFTDGTKEEFDHVIFATGFKMDLSVLDPTLVPQILDTSTQQLHLFKNMISPSIGPSLALIGFVQPTSGGILPMSEVQARYFSLLNSKKVSLPPVDKMKKTIVKDNRRNSDRFRKSERHTIQQDPLVFCEEVCALFGAKPRIWGHGLIVAYKLIFGSGGTAQWRLDGPGKWEGAKKEVEKVPVPRFIEMFVWLMVGLGISGVVAFILGLGLYMKYMRV